MLTVSRFVLRHKLAVAVFWLVVLAAGGAASAKLPGRLSAQFALPGAASYQASQQILRIYGNGGPGYPEVAVVTLPPGQSSGGPAGRQALGRAFAAAARIPGLRVADYAGTGDRAFLTRDPRVSYGLVFTPYTGELNPPSPGPQITAAMRPELPPGSTVAVTGMNELASGGQARQGFGVLAETLLAGTAALAVLAFVFGSALALVPLLMAAVAIPACFLALYGLTEITTVSIIVQYLAALIGLGVAIDYSLLLVTRWREELAAGHDSGEAVTRAMATAGRSIAYSGITVAIGLLSLIVLPVPALRSIGIGGMLVPAVSVAVTLTLLPALLATAGQRMDWPRRSRRAAASPAWSAWARLVVRRKWAAALAAVAVLAALGAAASGIKIGEPAASALGTTTPAAQTLRALEHAGVPAGVLDPVEVLAPAGTSPAQLARRLAALPGVRTATAPDGPAWRRDGTALVSVQPAAEPSTPQGAATLAAVRAAVPRGVLVSGPGALLLDENHAFYGRFPLLILAVAAITIILLARAFRSLLLPVKAVVLNLASVGATYGVIVLVWQHGHGSARDLGPARHRRHHQLGAADRLRVPVRPVHGLRGVHPDPDPRGTRPRRLRQRRHHRGHRPHRTAGHRRRPHPVLRLRRPVHRPRNRPQGDGHRPGRRDPARRHRGPRRPGTRPGRGVRDMELVAAGMGTPAAADPGPATSRTRHSLTRPVRSRAPGPAEIIIFMTGAAAAGWTRLDRPLAPHLGTGALPDLTVSYSNPQYRNERHGPAMPGHGGPGGFITRHA